MGCDFYLVVVRWGSIFLGFRLPEFKMFTWRKFHVLQILKNKSLYANNNERKISEMVLYM